MTPAEIEARLERHEKLLWWMSDAKRTAFIAELRADYIFEEQQRCVHEIFTTPQPMFSSDLPPHLSGAL
jgi:hypothetical protein